MFKILFQKDSSRHQWTCCVQILWNLADGKSVKSCITWQKKIFAWLSSSRYCADGAQNLWGPVPNNVLRVLQISSKAVHFRQCYIQMREHHQSALQSESNIRLKPSFEPNNYISFSALTQLGGCHEDHSPCKYRPKSPSEHIWGTQPNLE